MTTTSPKTPVNIFIASGSVLKTERKETIQVINELRKSFPFIDLEAVEWETDIPSGSYDKKRIQDEINSLLEKCQIVLVLFYSKIGSFTLEEYHLARGKNKKVFLYFKSGFSPKNKVEYDNYGKVFEFRDEIEKENRLLFKEYDSLESFKSILYKDLNLYLSNQYKVQVPVKEPDEQEIRKALFRGSRAYYDALRGPNGRFRFLKISDILLTGTSGDWLQTCVDLEENNQKLLRGGAGSPGLLGGGDFLEKSPPTIMEVLPLLWRMDVKHAVVVGEGGMGKTVSLIQWWEELLVSNEPVKPVPVFIALNEFNQVPGVKRENFILAQVVANYGKKGGVGVTADQVKKIMNTPLRSGGAFIPSVVLLLDGFNEITVEKRELLLELNHLTEQFPGIQVVITGRRDMRGDFNWSHWHPVRLKELEDEQVEGYLREQGTTGTAVPVREKGRLWELIKNPMMLTLYAASCEVQEKHRDSRLCSFKAMVESPGELLWNFIEAQVALLPGRVGTGEDRVVYYWFLLKYVLPGLGFEMEKAGLFDFTYRQFQAHLDSLCQRFAQGDFLKTVPQLGKYVKTLPVGDCGNEVDRQERAPRWREIFCGEMHMLVEEGETLRFLHQDFRDFFAAVHILNEVELGIRKKEIPVVLKERILDYFVRRFIGEIEGEHRCKPYLVKGEGWQIDIDKETRLHKVLDLCRVKFSNDEPTKSLTSQLPNFLTSSSAVWNIVEIWKEVRGELTGADLSGLDLTGASLNGVRCSRYYDKGDGRGCRYLGAEFGGSRVHEKNLLPQGHTDSVTSAVYSGDGKKILSASWDHTIKEWDAGTGQCVKTLAGHTDWVRSAVYSKDGKKILSASYDHTIKEWDAGTGECLKTFTGHEGTVESAVYSGNGKKILSASYDYTIKEWDAETGECVKTLAGHIRTVNSAVYSGDGEKILSASFDETIKEWDAGTGECVKTLAGHTANVTSSMYSADGKKILSASEDHTIKEWDAGTGQCVKTLAGHMSYVNTVVYSGDGKRILSASKDHTIKEWDAGTGQCVKTLAGHTDWVTSAVYSGDGKKILSASYDHTIKEWDAGTGECVKTLTGHKGMVIGAVYSVDGKKILSASADHTFKEWDVGTGQCLKTHKEADHPKLHGYIDFPAQSIFSTYRNKIFAPAAPGKEKKMEMINIPGLFIQGCSFKNLEEGSQWTPEGLKILRQYGARL